MKITKHIAKHNNQKTIIVYRQIPGEDHMCLVIYPDRLPNMFHDEVIRVLESDIGQQSKDLADVLFRHVMPDGRNCLESIHREGFMKKVPTNQVVVTPNAKSNIRLDELNGILNEMEKGEEAVKRMADLDSRQGMVSNSTPREVGGSPVSRNQAAEVNNTATLSDVLTDDQLAQQRLAQAVKMKHEAQMLLNEAARLEQEAESFSPKEVSNAKPKAAKKTAKKTSTKSVNERSGEVEANNS